MFKKLEKDFDMDDYYEMPVEEREHERMGIVRKLFNRKAISKYEIIRINCIERIEDERVYLSCELYFKFRSYLDYLEETLCEALLGMMSAAVQ